MNAGATKEFLREDEHRYLDEGIEKEKLFSSKTTSREI
jgi:hypothetical protein